MVGEDIFITYTGYTDLYIWLFFFAIAAVFFILSQTKLKAAKFNSILAFLISPALIWGSLGIAKLGYDKYASNLTSVLITNQTTINTTTITNTTTIGYEIFTYSPTYEVMASTWITVISVAFAIVALLNMFYLLVLEADETIGMHNKNPQHILTPDSEMWQVGEQKTGDVSNRASVEDFQVTRRKKHDRD